MDRLNEYNDERWKERAWQIRELDGHKCAMCGAKGVLHVHHLAYPPAPFHIWDATDDELVTLCPDCHKKVHESVTRVYLNKRRDVIGYCCSQAELDLAIDERLRGEFGNRWAVEREGTRDCCARCKNAKIDACGFIAYCPIQNGFCPVEPYQVCDYFDLDEKLKQ